MSCAIAIISIPIFVGAVFGFLELRRRSARNWRQAGIVWLKGTICDVHGPAALDGDDPPPGPTRITLCMGGRHQEVLLDRPHLDCGWSRPLLDVGDRVRIEAVWVNHRATQLSYREAAARLTLEALSVQRCRGVILRRGALSVAAAAILMLGLLLASSAAPQEDRTTALIDELQCPAGSRLQRVSLELQGRLGFCFQRESGLRHGPWLYLSVRGIKLVEGYYERGLRHRLWTVRAESGQAVARGRYDRGQQQGRWRYWDSAGHELRSARFRNGWPGSTYEL